MFGFFGGLRMQRGGTETFGTDRVCESVRTETFGMGRVCEGFDVKWFKKWSFLILIVVMGAVRLTVADGRRIYAEPFAKLQQQLEDIGALFRGAGQDEAETGESGADEAGAGESDTDGLTGSFGEGQDGTVGGNTDGSSGINGEEQDGTVGGNTDGSSGSLGEGQGGVGGSNTDGSSDIRGAGQDGEVPAYCTVEDDYFSDAVFIGDSRTVGMYEYGGLEETATFYASTGLTVYKLFTAEIVTVPGQKKKITIEEALQNTSFAKIYLMIGINEMGTGTVETFTKKYSEVLQHLRELQPDAVIYIQGIMKVTTERSEQGDYINNAGIEARNAELEKLADNRKLFYLDVNPLICDETGGMIPEYTFDGVHLKAEYIEIWKDFLKEHAVNPLQ